MGEGDQAGVVISRTRLSMFPYVLTLTSIPVCSSYLPGEGEQINEPPYPNNRQREQPNHKESTGRGDGEHVSLP